ncbi:hypothetical protein CH275_09180 [Rhodococcus sp. 06-235-1A]|uniref:hypothetical protein n=1 Tax=Rhodococcus sp. 06-235-1A TaxID=2022508 RepID=UPI000B9C014A|nr:hypothetical protein [Rhodococcus sp. 06-235-1A]OZD07298.1 hypothetical protein CH275_09180 [Rhodococcus sp. 06-235-1A]
MSKTDSVPSVEVLALLRQDRRDIAARLLASAFVPVIDDPYPLTTGARLGESLARDAGIRVSTWSWSIRRNPDATLARLILELVLLWERAGLACRGLALDANEVVLLAHGEELLRAGGVDAVRRALA